MQKALILLLLFLSSNVFAQSFEGTLSWSMKLEITDPQKKAQMEEAQNAMKDPEKLKEIEKQLSDPQFQQMMAQNPQLKAQMEKMMAMMKSGEGSLIPTGMTVKIKNQNSLSTLDGSFIDGEFLYLKEKDQTFIVDRKNKTYSVLNADKAELKEPADVKVTKTSETTKILNYNCTKYLVVHTVNGKPMTQTVWATKEIKDLDMSSLARQRMDGGKTVMFFKEIDGVPLKMEMAMPEGNLLMEAKQIKRESIPSSAFEIPSDFEEVKPTLLGQ